MTHEQMRLLTADQLRKLVEDRTGFESNDYVPNFNGRETIVCVLKSKDEVWPDVQLHHFFYCHNVNLHLHRYEFLEVDSDPGIVRPWEKYDKGRKRFFQRVARLVEGSLSSAMIPYYRTLLTAGLVVIRHPPEPVSVYRAAWCILDLLDKKPVDPEFFALHL